MIIFRLIFLVLLEGLLGLKHYILVNMIALKVISWAGRSFTSNSRVLKAVPGSKRLGE